jgi:hypothetical protein
MCWGVFATSDYPQVQGTGPNALATLQANRERLEAWGTVSVKR